jgi:hypothetical protein
MQRRTSSQILLGLKSSRKCHIKLFPPPHIGAKLVYYIKKWQEWSAYLYWGARYYPSYSLGPKRPWSIVTISSLRHWMQFKKREKSLWIPLIFIETSAPSSSRFRITLYSIIHKDEQSYHHFNENLWKLIFICSYAATGPNPGLHEFSPQLPTLHPKHPL